jgi:16S rRNA G1207 methylase RsmC
METENLATSEKNRAENMLHELESWQASVFDSLEGKDYKNKL